MPASEKADPAEPVYVVKLRELTDEEHAILDLERTWWRYPGVKEQEIWKRFNWSTTRYYQRLNELLEREEALAADPLLVKRLRRLRAGRARSRSARRLGTD